MWFYFHLKGLKKTWLLNIYFEFTTIQKIPENR